jgi:putative transposase
MKLRRPRRLHSFTYVGKYSYSVTFCTRGRHDAFISGERVECVRLQILRTCTELRFAVSAAVYMPNHLHMLVTGLDRQSDFKKCMTLSRARSALAYREAFKDRLWQDGYFERVLRDADDAREVLRYIANNPVDAGLCSNPEAYPYLWAPDVRSAAL